METPLSLQYCDRQSTCLSGTQESNVRGLSKLKMHNTVLGGQYYNWDVKADLEAKPGNWRAA